MPRMKPKTKAGKQKKIETVMSEFKAGTLRSGSGAQVTNRDQAIAIAMNEAAMSKKKRKTIKRKTAKR